MWVASYFTDEDASLHLAASTDGYDFAALNDGRPVLRGTVGTRQLRDPFLGIGPQGNFHLLATDGWSSPQIVHSTSEDLVTWSEQTLIPVMSHVRGARNAWAPEFFLDRQQNVYHLIWSSVVEPDVGETARDWQNVGQDHRIWHCTTADFLTFSCADLFFDPGYSVIDATVLADHGRYLMAFKDERGTNDFHTANKCVRLSTFLSPGGPFTKETDPVSQRLVEGPALFRRGDQIIMIYDHYLESRYGALESSDGTRWKPTSITLPAGMRHASILTVPSDRKLFRS
jgi:hypothetical protein